MPTDPSIPLGVKLPDIATPQQVQAQGLALQDKRLELQERQQKLAEQARAQGEQDAINKLYVSSADPATGKIDQQQFLGALAKNGLGTHVPVYQKSFDDANKSAAESAKAKSDADEAKNKAQIAEADYFGGLFSKVKASGYDPVILHSELDAAQASGHDVTPFQAALKQLPLQQAVDMGIQGSNAQRELAIKEKEANKPVSVGAGGLATQEGQVLVPPTTNLQSENVIYQGKQVQATFNPKTGKRTITDPTSGETLDVTGKTTPIPPASIQIQNQPLPQVELSDRQKEIARDLSTGGLSFADFTKLYPSRSGGQGAAIKEAIYSEAKAINPAFSPTEFETGQKMYGNPQIRQRMVAIDALTPAIDKAIALSKQLPANTDLPLLNKAIQAAQFQFGGKTVTNLDQLQTLLGDEAGNALGVGTGSDLKTKLGLDLVNTKLGTQNFIDTMNQLQQMLGARKQLLLGTMGPYGQAAGGAASSSGLPKVGDTFNGGKVLKVEKVQ